MKNKVKRITAILLSVVLLMSIVPFAAFAAEKDTESLKDISGKIDNQLYESYLSKHNNTLSSKKENSLFNFDFSVSNKINPFNAEGYYFEFDDASNYIRKLLKQRKSNIAFTFNFDYAYADYIEQLIVEMFAVAVAHTGKADEGAYISEQIYSALYSVTNVKYSDDYLVLDIEFDIEYVSTLTQEKAVNTAVDSIIADIDYSQSHYGIIKSVYDYICKNVTYVEDYETLKYFSAHSALINKKANSIGIALAFYRIINDMGFKCYFHSGYLENNSTETVHAWNMVTLNNGYLFDGALDCNSTKGYKWFLLGTDNFAKHTPFEPYGEILTPTAVKTLSYSKTDYVQFLPELKCEVDDESGYPLLTWKPNNNYTSYYIYRSDTLNSTSYSKIATTKETSYVDDDLPREYGTYYYRIIGVGSNRSDYSSVASLEIPQTGLPQISVDDVSGKPVIDWPTLIDMDRYYIYRATKDEKDAYSRIKIVYESNFTDKTAVAGTKYYYQIQPRYYSSNLTIIGARSYTVSATCKLAQPAITLSNNTSTGKPVIKWNAVDGAKGYKVAYATSANGEYKLLCDTTATSVTHKKAVTGTKYYYKVKAIHTNSAANSVYSAVKNVTCDLPAVTPSLSIKTSTGKPVIKWTAVEGAKGYKVAYATSADGTYKLLKDTTGTSVTHTGAAAGTKYYYKVRAIHTSSAANGAYGSAKNITCDLPAVTPSLSINATNGKPVISWNAVSGAKGYKVAYATSADGTYKLLKDTTGTSVTHTGAIAGTKYYYKVRAVHTNSAATGAYGSVKSVICDLPAVTPSLSVDTTSGKPVITWYAVDGAVSYKVAYATSADGEYKLLCDTTATTVTHKKAAAGTKYYYKVRAIHTNSSANGAYGGAKNITCDLPVPTMTVALDTESGKPVITWNAVDGAASYKVAYATSADGEYKLLCDTTDVTATHKKAVAGTTYYYKVRAIHSASAANGAYCDAAFVTSN